MGARVVNEPGTWTMSSLHVVDTGAAVAFYGAVFGWQPEAFGPLTLFRLPGYVGGEEGQPIPRDVVAAMAPPDPNVPPHWNVNFRVADADAIAASAAAARRDGARGAVRHAGLSQRDPRRPAGRGLLGQRAALSGRREALQAARRATEKTRAQAARPAGAPSAAAATQNAR